MVALETSVLCLFPAFPDDAVKSPPLVSMVEPERKVDELEVARLPNKPTFNDPDVDVMLWLTI